jgi:hypothetical protein
MRIGEDAQIFLVTQKRKLRWVDAFCVLFTWVEHGPTKLTDKVGRGEEARNGEGRTEKGEGAWRFIVCKSEIRNKSELGEKGK